MEYVIFDQDCLDVPIQDYPVGNIAICPDPQHRLGNPTWAAVWGLEPQLPPKALGLFWDKKEAIRYAKSFESEDDPEMSQEEMDALSRRVEDGAGGEDAYDDYIGQMYDEVGPIVK